MGKTTKTTLEPVQPIEETVEPAPCCGKDGCDECPYNEPAVEAPVAVASGKTYTAKDGDTYPSIAAEFVPNGMSKFEYATMLVALNNGKALADGVEVVL